MSSKGMGKVPDEGIPAINEEVVDGSVQAVEEETADSGFLALQNEASVGSVSAPEDIATGNSDSAVEMPTLPEGYFNLEAIRKKRMNKGRTEYLIKWDGYQESDNTWEPYEHLRDCAEVVEEFERGLQSRKGKSGKKHKACQKRRSRDGEHLAQAGPSNVSETDCRIIHRNQDDPAIVKIIRRVSTEVSDAEVLLKFAVLRSDGKEDTADNKYMKMHCPQMLFDFYERYMVCTEEAADKGAADKEAADKEAADKDVSDS